MYPVEDLVFPEYPNKSPIPPARRFALEAVNLDWQANAFSS
jgi:hypothetical protein